MKKQVLFCSILLISIFACKKSDDSTTDERDKFIGSYTVVQKIVVPGLQINETRNITCSIEKEDGDDKIIFFNSDLTQPTAVVDGTSYEYQPYEFAFMEQGVITSIYLTGEGSINGNVITESGIYKIAKSGVFYNGTITCTYTKQ